MTNENDPPLNEKSPRVPAFGDPIDSSADAAQQAFVERLRNISLSKSTDHSSSDNSTSSSLNRDRLIYDCGYAAGLESKRQRQSIDVRRYRLAAMAAALLAMLMGAFAWQSNRTVSRLASHLQSVEKENNSALNNPESKPYTSADLAAAWVAVQNNPTVGITGQSWLTPSSRSIETGEFKAPTVSDSLEQAPSQIPLRSRDYQSVLEWEV